jgi:hypothetical protein
LTWYVKVCAETDLRSQLTAIGGGAELGPLIPDLPRRLPDLPAPPAMNPEGHVATAIWGARLSSSARLS